MIIKNMNEILEYQKINKASSNENIKNLKILSMMKYIISIIYKISNGKYINELEKQYRVIVT